jgi:hypothetical protein
MAMRPWVRGGFLVVFLALGCGASGPGRGGVPSAPPGEIEELSAPGDPVVTLLEPGDEPRAPLRYRYTAGRRTSLFVDMGTTMTMAVGNQPKTTIDAPPVRLALDTEVLEVAASTGTAQTRSTVERVDVMARPSDPPELVEAVARETGSLVGMGTDVRITSRGFVRNVKLNVPENVNPKLRSIIEDARNMTQQTCGAFPKESVGLGAHWRVDSKIKTSILTVEQTALVTLIERDENRVVLSVTVHQTAPKQRLELADLTPGTEATLESYVGHGNGRSETPLDGGAAHAEINVRSSFVTAVAAGEQQMKVSNEMEMTIKISPTESPRAAGRASAHLETSPLCKRRARP